MANLKVIDGKLVDVDLLPPKQATKAKPITMPKKPAEPKKPPLADSLKKPATKAADAATFNIFKTLRKAMGKSGHHSANDGKFLADRKKKFGIK